MHTATEGRWGGRRATIQRASSALVLSAFVLGASTGCALFSADRRGDKGDENQKVSPLAEAHERSRSLVEEARQEGRLDTERERSYLVKVRYNPGRCGAPGEEIFAYGNWQRVALVGKNERVELMMSEWRARAQDEPLRHQKIEGRWDEREWIAASGVVWPVFRVDALTEVESAQHQPGAEEDASGRLARLDTCTP